MKNLIFLNSTVGFNSIIMDFTFMTDLLSAVLQKGTVKPDRKKMDFVKGIKNHSSNLWTYLMYLFLQLFSSKESKQMSIGW